MGIGGPALLIFYDNFPHSVVFLHNFIHMCIFC